MSLQRPRKAAPRFAYSTIPPPHKGSPQPRPGASPERSRGLAPPIRRQLLRAPARSPAGAAVIVRPNYVPVDMLIRRLAELIVAAAGASGPISFARALALLPATARRRPPGSLGAPPWTARARPIDSLTCGRGQLGAEARAAELCPRALRH